MYRALQSSVSDGFAQIATLRQTEGNSSNFVEGPISAADNTRGTKNGPIGPPATSSVKRLPPLN